MRALVTGGTGFVGAAVIRRLLDEGLEVRALARSSSDTRNIDGLSVDRVTGDVTDVESIDRAVRGCDEVYHVAADYRLFVPDPERMHRINVDGTTNVLQAAADAGVRRVVHTSSVATLGVCDDGAAADEDEPATLDDMVGPYKRTKYLAEEEARRWAAEGLDVVIVNPSTPVGPRDVKPTPTGRMVLDAVTGRMPAYVDTGLNVVHVDDVAEGHRLAMLHGRVGERYILGGENLFLRDILGRLARMSGRRPPLVRLPHGLVLPMAHVSEWFTRLTGGTEPRLTVTGLKLARKHMFFSSDRARRELGYVPRPVDEALRDAMDWFLHHTDGRSAA
ncbi:MAG: hopanoid-associated sugar epimerase [Candidatus Wenzhouxiangella sp. M2_3B_020]